MSMYLYLQLYLYLLTVSAAVSVSISTVSVSVSVLHPLLFACHSSRILVAPKLTHDMTGPQEQEEKIPAKSIKKNTTPS